MTFSTPYWLSQVQELETQLGTETLPNNFLENQILRHTMVADDPDTSWGNAQLEFVLDCFGYRAIEILSAEPAFGSPPLREFSAGRETVVAVHNSIHHLYHIARWMEATGAELPDQVLEWGGGFGNMARIFRALKPEVQYTILDLPYMNWIQGQYLKEMGLEGVQLCDSEAKADLVTGPNSLFVSTWALSECTEEAQEFVESCSFFGAKGILIAHQVKSDLFEAADGIGSRLKRCGYAIQEQDFRFTGRGDKYIFAGC